MPFQAASTAINNFTINSNQTEEITTDDVADDDSLTPLALSLIGIFLSLVIFLSVTGNILVCIAIYTERSLRRIGNLFLASLAVADLFVSSLVMTFALVNDLLGTIKMIFLIIEK